MIIGAGNAQESNHPGSKAVIRALGYDCFFFRDMLSGEVVGVLVVKPYMTRKQKRYKCGTFQEYVP